MKWFDFLIVIIPVFFVLGMGLYSRRYLKDATSFLSAGRVCGRYVISMGDIANALSIIALLSYVEVHYLDRMLHRGKYAIDGERQVHSAWSWKTVFGKIVGITPEYTFWDRVIAWGYFYYTIVYRFLGAFILVVIWNIFDPWPISWWGWYFLIIFLIIPGFMAAFTAVWFGICGTIDLKQMFHDLNARVVNPLDNGRVEGNVSLADKAAMDKIDQSSLRK